MMSSGVGICLHTLLPIQKILIFDVPPTSTLSIIYQEHMFHMKQKMKEMHVQQQKALADAKPEGVMPPKDSLMEGIMMI